MKKGKESNNLIMDHHLRIVFQCVSKIAKEQELNLMPCRYNSLRNSEHITNIKTYSYDIFIFDFFLLMFWWECTHEFDEFMTKFFTIEIDHFGS